MLLLGPQAAQAQLQMQQHQAAAAQAHQHQPLPASAFDPAGSQAALLNSLGQVPAPPPPLALCSRSTQCLLTVLYWLKGVSRREMTRTFSAFVQKFAFLCSGGHTGI